MSAFMKFTVIESNFAEDVLEGREVSINLDHVRLVVHNEQNSLLFFQNEDCLKVQPRIPDHVLASLSPESKR
jgi:hypothetical protein